MAESFEQVDQPPPRPGGFDGDGTRRGELRKERLELPEVVRQAMLGQLAVRGEDRDLRHAFVKVHADVYHRPGLLFSECFGGLSEFPAYSGLGGRPTHLWHHYGVRLPMNCARAHTRGVVSMRTTALRPSP